MNLDWPSASSDDIYDVAAKSCLGTFHDSFKLSPMTAFTFLLLSPFNRFTKLHDPEQNTHFFFLMIPMLGHGIYDGVLFRPWPVVSARCTPYTPQIPLDFVFLWRAASRQRLWTCNFLIRIMICLSNLLKDWLSCRQLASRREIRYDYDFR